MTTASVKFELDVNVGRSGTLKEVVKDFDVDQYMRTQIIPALKKAGLIEEWIDGNAELTGVFK